MDTRSEDSGSSHQAPESTASTDGRDTWTDESQGYKMYNIVERRVDIRRLAAAFKGIEDLTDRRKRLHLYLSQLLQQKRERIERIKKLKRLKQSSETWMQKGKDAQSKIRALEAHLGEQQNTTKSSFETLRAASADLKVVFRRKRSICPHFFSLWQDAAGRWHKAQISLVHHIVQKSRSAQNVDGVM